MGGKEMKEEKGGDKLEYVRSIIILFRCIVVKNSSYT